MNAGDDTLTLGQLLNQAGWLRRLAVALVRDPDAAEDVVQNALVSTWQHPPDQNPEPAGDPRQTRSWLARVVRNQALDQRRADLRRQRREQATAALAPQTAASPEQLIGDLQIHREVAEVVSALDEPYRQTVVLRFYEGLNAAEVARKLGVPAGTVRWRLKEGLDRVRVQLDSRHGGERRRWVAALAPLTGQAQVSTPTTPPPAAQPAAAPGAVTVTAVLGTAALAAVGVWASFFRSPARAPEAPGDGDPGVRTVIASPQAAAGSKAAPPRFIPAPAAARPVAAPVRPGDPDSLMRRLLASATANDYDAFLEFGADTFKAAISPQDLRALSIQIAPMLAGGYAAHPLGTIRTQHGLVHLWKVEAPGQPDDLLVRLTMEADKVTGFLVE